MLKLVIGGAASGKSAFAQRMIEEDYGAGSASPSVCPTSPVFEDGETGELIYLATMKTEDEESLLRVRRHLDMRDGRGYRTIELPRDIERAQDLMRPGSFVLIEDMTNLCANEMFSGDVIPSDDGGLGALSDKIVSGIEKLCAYCAEVVAVTGELCSDGAGYGRGLQRHFETEDGDSSRDLTYDYLKLLSEVNYRLAKRAAYVAEIVCGLPSVFKDDCSAL